MTLGAPAPPLTLFLIGPIKCDSRLIEIRSNVN
jgi:hypothetical protein